MMKNKSYAVENVEIISRVTGKAKENEKILNPNETDVKYGITATDLGIMWDAATNIDEKPKIMVAFGDSYDHRWNGHGGGGGGWRSNFLAVSTDLDLSKGLVLSSVVTEKIKNNYAKEIINSAHDMSGNGDFTAIPTSGVTLKDRHYIHYMQVKKWNEPGEWDTNFSELAFSDDSNSWIKSGIKWNSASHFAQVSFVKNDNELFMFGTKSGRFSGICLSKVKEENILKKEEYKYWDGNDWVNDESEAIEIVESPVSELSVQYNSYYQIWLMMYLNEKNDHIVLRTSKHLENGWSDEIKVMRREKGFSLYGSFIHPLKNDKDDLYFVISVWEPYNVFLVHSKIVEVNNVE